MSVTHHRDIVIGAIVVMAALGLYGLSFTINEAHFSGVGAEFMPRLVAFCIGALGFALIWTTKRKIAEDRADGKTPEKKQSDVASNGYLLVGLNILLFGVYLCLLEGVGFLLTTPVYLFLQMLLLSNPSDRKYGRFVVVSIATAVVSYYLFIHAFQVILPAGILG